MNGSYLIPANAKKGTLIFNLFRPFDLILFSIGAGISLLMLALFSNSSFWFTLICCLPAAITGLLVVPIPNYHNVLCALQSVIQFYNNRRKFIWRGWCFYEYFKDEGKSK